MAIIINEFEAVIEPPRRQGDPGVQMQAPGKEPPPPLTPFDMEEILRRRLERMARVLAD